MKNDEEKMEWDYFLTNYEKDLLSLPENVLFLKYSNICQPQIISDKQDIYFKQIAFEVLNR